MRRRFRWVLRLALGLLLLAVVCGAAILLLRDTLARNMLVSRLRSATGMEVTLEPEGLRASAAGAGRLRSPDVATLPYPGFAQCFANGLPASEAAALAATQRPIAYSAGSDPSGVPAWLTIPSWSLIGTADHVIPPAEQMFMSKRAGAHITEVNAGHLSLISDPGAVTSVIIAAALATG